MMVAVQQVPLSITDGNVNPRQLLAGFLRRSDFSCMLLNYLIKSAIARKLVSFNFRVGAQGISDNTIDRISGLIFHNFHFKELTPRGWPLLLRILNFLGFCHDQYRGLLFATSSSLGWLLRTSFKLGVNAFKKAFIHLNRTGQDMFFIPGGHRYPNLMHHIPDWFITFSSKLALNFQCRKALFRGGHKMNGLKPNQEREVGRLHDRTTSQGCSGSTLLALKLTDALHPVMFGSFTLPAGNSLFLTILPEKIPARLLVGELVVEIYKLHNHNFDTKLQGQNVTYLRYGT